MPGGQLRSLRQLVYSPLVGARPVVVIAPDERWLRVLEITLRLGDFQPIARRSIREAMVLRAGEDQPSAVLLDLGADSDARDIEAVRELLSDADVRMVVILPARLAAEREQIERSGAVVLIRPYRPSQLYRALGDLTVDPSGAGSSGDAREAGSGSAAVAGDEAGPAAAPAEAGAAAAPAEVAPGPRVVGAPPGGDPPGDVPSDAA